MTGGNSKLKKGREVSGREIFNIMHLTLNKTLKNNQMKNIQIPLKLPIQAS